MELVEGEDLAHRIARAPIPVDEAVAIAKQVADALAAAHGTGIVHRDLKPANIKLRADGTAKVLDFGLAKLTAATGADRGNDSATTTSADLTRHGILLGTAAYMAPEQARGRPVDKRADIWAFGCVLYEMLTGRRLFEGDTLSDILADVLRKKLPWHELPPETPPSLVRLLRQCLQRDPAHRLHDAADLRLLLDWMADEEVARPERPQPGLGPRRVGALAAMAGSALIAGGVAGWLAAGGLGTAPRGTVAPIVRFAFHPPDGVSEISHVALAPDGRFARRLGSVHTKGALTARRRA
jgi:eukaryotic-like serine/threonine-protein kinase